MWEELEERVVNLKNEKQVAEVRDFLAKFQLSYDGNVEYTANFYKDEELVASGSLAGKVLRNIAISPKLQGEGINAHIISHLIREQSSRGRFHYFIFTKPDKSKMFEGLGFKEIARAEPYAVLLESGLDSVAGFCKRINDQTKALPQGRRAALVVNCNPFTLGHRAVIETAAKENDAVIVFVVSENRSLFPFDVRFRLVKEGLKELPNILVVPGGDYIISEATFPGYFTRGEDTVAAQTHLDAALFATQIAPQLAIQVRYVGEEPYCNVTNSYNCTLAEVLPKHGINLTMVPRKEVGGEIISASKVRDMLRLEDWEGIKQAVPDSTYQFLKSEEAKSIIAKIKQSQSRH